MKRQGKGQISSIDVTSELAALARMVTFARQSAADLKAERPVYHLDQALAALLDEINSAKPEAAGEGNPVPLSDKLH